jgi:hypothetical protein
MSRRSVAVGAFGLAMFLAGLAVGGAQTVSRLLKTGGAIAVADRFGPQIDDGINTVTRQNDLGDDVATKIVPILSVGDGKFVGIVQIAGPAEQVERVNAVAQIELRVPVIRTRARAMIPIDTRSLTDMSRVSGVGVSALVDLRL